MSGSFLPFSTKSLDPGMKCGPLACGSKMLRSAVLLTGPASHVGGSQESLSKAGFLEISRFQDKIK